MAHATNIKVKNLVVKGFAFPGDLDLRHSGGQIVLCNLCSGCLLLWELTRLRRGETKHHGCRHPHDEDDGTRGGVSGLSEGQFPIVAFA